MPIITSEFKPTGLLSNPHLQTILANKLFTPAIHATTRERVELPDGDFLDIEFSQTSQSDGDVVAIFHGLAGNKNSPYIQGAFNTLSASGFRPVLMHWRGCSGEPNRLARAYHSGASDDIAWFINDHLAQRFSNTRIMALGYSLGANALLKYLGESGKNTPVIAAMAVSPPLVLSEGAYALNRGLSRIYQRYLLRLLRMQHEKKRYLRPELNLPQAGPELNTLWKFDDSITAPLHGFNGAQDYHTQCSSRQYLPGIAIPTHILSAVDDPFFTTAIFPEACELAPLTTLEMAQKGGHVGFLNKQARWLDTHVANTLTDLISNC